MPFSGGTFTRVHNFEQDRINSILVNSGRMDAEFDGVATGLSLTILKDGSQTITADIPWNSRKITGLGDATTGTDALNRQSADARYFRAGDALSSAAALITSNSANALAVGRQGLTDPVLRVNASAATVATGIDITGAAAGGGVFLSAISSGANEILDVSAKGTGALTLGGLGTGIVASARQVQFSNATASTTPSTGALIVTGGVGVGGALNVGGAGAFTGALSAGGAFTTNGNITSPVIDATLELGLDGTASTPKIDFHSSANSNDYDVRISAVGGDGSDGNGVLALTALTVQTSQHLIVSQSLTVAGATALQGAATAPTPAAGDDSTNIATTAFVQDEGFAKINNQTSDTATIYPIGTIVIPGQGGAIRNSTSTMHYTTANTTTFQTSSSGGTALAGTWRCCGTFVVDGGFFSAPWQRIA